MTGAPMMNRRGKKAKVLSQSLASRLPGVSALGFGVSWKAPEPERDVVQGVITFLEDRRALYGQSVWEEPAHVIQSVLKIREELTDGLKRVGDNSPAKGAFRIMRAACRAFLDQSSTKSIATHDGMLRDYGYQTEEFFVGLGIMRAIFGQQLAVLAYLYKINVEEQLATIMPPSGA